MGGHSGEGLRLKIKNMGGNRQIVYKGVRKVPFPPFSSSFLFFCGRLIDFSVSCVYTFEFYVFQDLLLLDRRV